MADLYWYNKTEDSSEIIVVCGSGRVLIWLWCRCFFCVCRDSFWRLGACCLVLSFFRVSCRCLFGVGYFCGRGCPAIFGFIILSLRTRDLRWMRCSCRSSVVRGYVLCLCCFCFVFYGGDLFWDSCAKGFILIISMWLLRVDWLVRGRGNLIFSSLLGECSNWNWLLFLIFIVWCVLALQWCCFGVGEWRWGWFCCDTWFSWWHLWGMRLFFGLSTYRLCLR